MRQGQGDASRAGKDSWGIHWFRRDLRVSGNPALRWSWQEHRGKVLGVFCFDRKFLAREDFSECRFQFFLETLQVLRRDLQEVGSDLLVLDIGPDEAFAQLRARLSAAGGTAPATVSFNRDYEPFARDRDARMTARFETELGLRVHTERDHLLIEPSEILKEGVGGRGGGGYQVYTPFKRRWLEKALSEEVKARVAAQKSREPKRASERFSWSDVFQGAVPFADALERYLAENRARVSIPIPEAGAAAARAQLRAFSAKLDRYEEARDIPGIAGTSRLSMFFKNGSLTVAQTIHELGLLEFANQPATSAHKFLSELVWREFYYHILHHFPYVEHGAFVRKYDAIRWENREDLFSAWREGRTGYPIVDAGMRQLNSTGWMHNRVRMIVASFLTKDLLISWQWGERYFMRKLLDGDLAPNNGGWQWAASTGCDPQPYFRIFNPRLQSEKFDSEGEYIRQFVPELRGMSARDIHEPSENRPSGYPAPIVDHATQKTKALALFKTLPNASKVAP